MASAKKGQAVLAKSCDYGGDYRLPKDELRLFWKRHRLAEARDIRREERDQPLHDEQFPDLIGWPPDDDDLLSPRERKILEVMQ